MIRRKITNDRWNAVCGENRMHGVTWGKTWRLHPRVTYHDKQKLRCCRRFAFICKANVIPKTGTLPTSWNSCAAPRCARVRRTMTPLWTSCLKTVRHVPQWKAAASAKKIAIQSHRQKELIIWAAERGSNAPKCPANTSTSSHASNSITVRSSIKAAEDNLSWTVNTQ